MRIALAFAAFSTIAPAAAEDWGGAVQATSDYVFRGLSQTRGRGALQLDAHYVHDAGWFAGAFASTVRFGDNVGPDAELNPYVGWTWRLGENLSAKLTARQYLYRGGDQYVDYDYDEFVGSLDWGGRVALSFAWSPNMTRIARGYVAKDRPAKTFELTGYQPVTAHTALSAGVGYQDLEALFHRGYWFYSVGCSWTAGAWGLDVLRYAADDTAETLFGSAIVRNGWSTNLRWRF
jgi:uncharacterized protein (TIGR02001 family)